MRIWSAGIESAVGLAIKKRRRSASWLPDSFQFDSPFARCAEVLALTPVRLASCAAIQDGLSPVRGSSAIGVGRIANEFEAYF